MAEYKNDVLGTKFTVSDKLTVAKQLDYNSRIFALQGEHMFLRQFLASMLLIENWESAVVPDLSLVFKSKEQDDEVEGAIYLDEATDPRITSLIMWVGGEVVGHVLGLETVPKK